MPPLLRHSAVLAKELLCFKRGAANLWPDHPLDFSTELGDVGWIGRDGQFIRLVNTFKDGHRNIHGLPPKFVLWDVPKEYFKEIPIDLRPGETLCTAGATVTKINL